MRAWRWHLAHIAAYLQRRAERLRLAGVGPAVRRLLRRAEAAEAAWRYADALEAWSAIRARAPGLVLPAVREARMLAKLAREPEAIAVLQASAVRFPRSALVALDLARMTVRTAAFAEALALCRSITTRFPGHPLGYELTAKALFGLSRVEEADAVVEAAQARFPSDLGLAVEAATIADRRSDWTAMLERSERMLQRFPDAPLAHACVGGALRKLQRFDEADRVLKRAVARFPKDSNLAVNHAWVADHRGDHDEAWRRWTAVNARFGANPEVRYAYLERVGRQALSGIDVSEAPAGLSRAPAAPAPSVAPATAPHATLVSRFHSLGANCEFGFVQRHFGAEPMGMLRWAGIGYDALLAGLAADFAGVGSAEQTRLGVNPKNQEYHVSDTAYGLAMHTFVLESAAPADAMHVKMCRRLAFLRDHLIETLRIGKAIFAFHAEAPLTDDDARALHRAIRRHGPGRLLFVRVAGPGERPGTVVPLDDGLALGLLDRTGLRNGHWNVSFDCWLQLCRSAEALFGRTD